MCLPRICSPLSIPNSRDQSFKLYARVPAIANVSDRGEKREKEGMVAQIRFQFCLCKSFKAESNTAHPQFPQRPFKDTWKSKTCRLGGASVRARRQTDRFQKEKETWEYWCSVFRSYRWRGSIQDRGLPGLQDSPSWRCDSSCDRVSAQACCGSTDSTASWSRLWRTLELRSPVKQRDVLQLRQVWSSSLNLSISCDGMRRVLQWRGGGVD